MPRTKGMAWSPLKDGSWRQTDRLRVPLNSDGSRSQKRAGCVAQHRSVLRRLFTRQKKKIVSFEDVVSFEDDPNYSGTILRVAAGKVVPPGRSTGNETSGCDEESTSDSSECTDLSEASGPWFWAFDHLMSRFGGQLHAIDSLLDAIADEEDQKGDKKTSQKCNMITVETRTSDDLPNNITIETRNPDHLPRASDPSCRIRHVEKSSDGMLRDGYCSCVDTAACFWDIVQEDSLKIDCTGMVDTRVPNEIVVDLVRTRSTPRTNEVKSVEYPSQIKERDDLGVPVRNKKKVPRESPRTTVGVLEVLQAREDSKSSGTGPSTSTSKLSVERLKTDAELAPAVPRVEMTVLSDSVKSTAHHNGGPCSIDRAEGEEDEFDPGKLLTEDGKEGPCELKEIDKTSKKASELKAFKKIGRAILRRAFPRSHRLPAKQRKPGAFLCRGKTSQSSPLMNGINVDKSAQCSSEKAIEDEPEVGDFVVTFETQREGKHPQDRRCCLEACSKASCTFTSIEDLTSENSQSLEDGLKLTLLERFSGNAQSQLKPAKDAPPEEGVAIKLSEEDQEDQDQDQEQKLSMKESYASESLPKYVSEEEVITCTYPDDTPDDSWWNFDEMGTNEFRGY
jgi:hypothetical protein